MSPFFVLPILHLTSSYLRRRLYSLYYGGVISCVSCRVVLVHSLRKNHGRLTHQSHKYIHRYYYIDRVIENFRVSMTLFVATSALCNVRYVRYVRYSSSREVSNNKIEWRSTYCYVMEKGEGEDEMGE
jgi:hypothetical protein